MPSSLRPSFNAFCVLLVLFIMLAAPGICQKETPPLLLSRFLQANLKSSLIVLEGDHYVDETEQQTLKNILRSSRPVREKVKAVADTCDYEARVYEGTYLFNKRYTDSNELPCVSREEIIAFAEDVSRTVAPIFASTKEVSLIERIDGLLLALPEADWQQIQQDVLPVSSLSTGNRRTLTGMLTESFCGSLRYESNLVTLHLRNLDDAALELNKTDDHPYVICQAYRNGKAAHSWPIFVNARNPNPSRDNVSKSVDRNASFFSTKLKDILKELNTRSKDGTMFSASPALLDKPISGAGLESAPPRQALVGIARLCELQLVAVGKNELQLSRKRRRASRTDNATPSIGQQASVNLPYAVQQTLENRNYKVPTTLLLNSLIPQVQKAKGRSIPVRDLDSLHQTAIVLNVFAQLAREVYDDDSSRLPAYLSRLDSLYLRCRRSPRSFTLTLLTLKDGKLVGGPEYGVSRDVKRK